MKTTLRTALVALVALVAVIALVLTIMPNDEPQIAHGEAFYPEYMTVDELTRDSQVVLRGTVVEKLGSRQIIPAEEPNKELPAFKRQHAGYTVTDFTVRVDSVLEGNNDLAGKTIQMTQMGGTLGKRTVIVDAEPLSEKGDELLLFLRQGSDGGFRVVGGAQGRYKVENGKLAVISAEAEHLAVTSVLEGKAVNEVETKFNELKTAQPTLKAKGEVQEPLRLPASAKNEVKPDGAK